MGKDTEVYLKIVFLKRGRKKIRSIFSVLCCHLNFFFSTNPSLVFAWLCAPIDWQLAPEPLRPLKIPGRGFRFQAPASGPAIVCVWKAGSIRAQPSQSHSGCMLCVFCAPCLRPTGPWLGGADRVSTLTRTWRWEERQVDSTHAQAPIVAGALKSVPFLTLLTHSLSPTVLAFCSAC